MEGFSKAFCEDTMMTAACTVISNLESLRRTTNNISVVRFLRELANLSEEHCKNGPSRYDDLDSSNRKSTIPARSHLSALGGLICRITGEYPTGPTFPFLRELVIGYSGYLDMAANILSRVVRECPQWFSDLPILTMFCIIIYVVHTEISWIQDCLPNAPEEDLQMMLQRQRGREYNLHMDVFISSYVSLFTNFHFEMESYCNDGIPLRRGNVDKLPKHVKDCFNGSVQFLKGIDKVFGYSIFRDEYLMHSIRAGWDDVQLDNNGNSSLKIPATGAHFFCCEKLVWAKHLRYLLGINKMSHPESIIRSFLICRDLTKVDHLSEELSSYGHTSEKGKRRLRHVALQMDMFRIWNVFYDETKPIVEYFAKKCASPL